MRGALLVTGFARAFYAAEGDHRLAVRFVLRHARGYVGVDLLLDVEAQLFVDVGAATAD